MERKMSNNKLAIIFVIILSVVLAGMWFKKTTVDDRADVFVGHGIRDEEYSLIAPDGFLRKYIIHLPPSYSKNIAPLPVVLAFHGGESNAETMRTQTGFNEKADKEGFIVVYPSGIYVDGGKPWGETDWNVGTCCGYIPDTYSDNDDIGFIRMLIDKLSKDFNVDQGRIYATGFSIGAIFTHRLGCELSDKIAAIAPVSGGSTGENCNPERPMPAIEFHGPKLIKAIMSMDDDFTLKFVDGSSIFIPAWARLNACQPLHVKEKLFDIVRDGVTVVRESYTDCRDDADVILYIHGGGHVWPGGKSIAPEYLDVIQIVSANDIIWDFFKAYPKSRL